MQRFLNWLKKYFIPHGQNDYKPHLLRYESILIFFFAIIIIELAFLVQVFIVFDKTKFLAAVLPAVLTTLTNEEREQNDAPPLVENELLTKAAQLKAEDMATHGYFAHTSPEGKTPWYWFNQVNYRYTAAGENLAVNFFESSDVAEAWMNSPSHRANIVKKDYTEIGIGIANGIYQGRNTVFVAQLFGTPLKTFLPAQVEASAPTIENPGATPAKLKTPVPTPQPAPAPKVEPPVTTPTLPPVSTPPVVAVAPVVSPTATEVLGEEVDTPVLKTEPATTPFNLKSFIQKVLTSPREYATYAYGGIALLIVFTLLLTIFIRYEIQHPKLIGRGIALVAVIVFLLFVNIKVFNLETKIPAEGISANVIAY